MKTIYQITPGITFLCRAVCLRFDDYHQANDIKLWKETLREYDKRGLRGVVGVCPVYKNEQLSEEHTQFLHKLRSNGWEVAQHGYTHEDIADKEYQSEFRGVPEFEQRRRIAAGQDILSDFGFNPDTFIPPWHQYDAATIRAISNCGLNCLNEGRFPWLQKKEGVTLIPTHPKGFHPKTIALGVLTLVGHPHLEDNPMKNAEYVAGHKEKIQTPQEILQEGKRFSILSKNSRVL